MPQFQQAWMLNSEDRQYAITRKTQSVDLAALQDGLQFGCRVIVKLPRMATATLVL